MAEQHYERDEKMLEERRKRRAELKRKRMLQSRLIMGAALVVLILIIILIARGCGKQEEEPEPVEPITPAVTREPDKPETKPEEKKTVTLSAVGDIMVYGSQVEDAKKDDGSYDFLPSLASVSTLLTASDLTVGNFEATFAGEPYDGFPNFSAPESLANTLSGLGFDILQTANTYSIQGGMTGLAGTVNTIRGAGMDSLGTYLSAADREANQVVVREVNGIKVAFVAFTKSVNNLTLPKGSEYCVDLLCTDYDTTYASLDRTSIVKVLDTAKAQDPDVIVAMLHWGSEFENDISELQSQATDLLIKNGVDVILGSHPHIVGKMELKTVEVDGREKQVFVAYSLGNFLAGNERGQKNHAPSSFESVILNLEFTKDKDETTITAANYVPLYIVDNGEEAINRYQVRNVYDVLDDNPDSATAGLMKDAVEHLKKKTESTFDRGK